MASQVQTEIESLWNSKRHGTVDAVSLKYHVFAEETLRKIKVSYKGAFLPVEFYSIEALLLNQQKIVEMAQSLKDSRVARLRAVLRVSDAELPSTEETIILEPQKKFDTTYYAFTNKGGFVCVILTRPSGDIFYQRLATPDLLAYALSNQVGFLLVNDPVNDVYTSPDTQIEFSFVEDSIKIVKDVSKQ